MNTPATQVDGSVLTKPHDWSIHMVIAALKYLSNSPTTHTHPTPDAAKHSILKTLNWHEAHDEYKWPDFSTLNYNFDQVMRLRRALVADIYNALHKAGEIKIGAPDTADSSAATVGTRRARRLGGGENNYSMKRFCQPPEHYEEEVREGIMFLDEVIIQLICHSRVDMEKLFHEKRSGREVGQLVYDDLVAVWEKPLREDGEYVQLLKEKARAWEKVKKGGREAKEQNEPDDTPKGSVKAGKGAPESRQGDRGGSAPTGKAYWEKHGWQAAKVTEVPDEANDEWAETNTLG